MSPDHSQEREGKGACGRRQPYQICVLAPWVEAHSFCLFTAVGIIHRAPPPCF